LLGANSLCHFLGLVFSAHKFSPRFKVLEGTNVLDLKFIQ
jgi:hypothetical protein